MFALKIIAWTVGGAIGLVVLFVLGMYVLLINDKPGTDS